MPSVREFYKFIWETVSQEQVEFEDNGLDSIFRARVRVSQKNLDFLLGCQDEFICEPENYQTIEIDREIDLIRKADHKPEDGVFFSFKEPLLTLDFQAIEENNFYIADLNYESSETLDADTEVPVQVQFINHVSSAVKVLKETKDFQAGTNLIFFGRDTMKVQLSISHEDLDLDFVNEVVSSSNTNILESFIDWFSSEDPKNHQGNKKAIFKQSLFEILSDKPQANRFRIFLGSFDRLAEGSMKSYELYLEDFNYSKFSKKLEEKRIEYFEKITKVILDVRNQVIGLPVVFVLLNVARQTGNVSGFILLGMLAYCLVLLVILSQQLSYIDDIGSEINKFTRQNTESDSMKSELDATRIKLESRLKSQRHVISFFQMLILLAGALSIVQYFSSS